MNQNSELTQEELLIAKKCYEEIEEVLKRNNCSLGVSFEKQKVINHDVLSYNIQIIVNRKS